MKALLLLLLLLIVAITQLNLVVDATSWSSPPQPVFPDNYFVTGLISLPYAELREPFAAWYDAKAGKSRNDFYGDLYKIYQFGPKKGGDNVSRSEQIQEDFGVMYKLAYVPASFHPIKSASLIGSLRDKLPNFHLTKDRDSGAKTKTRRACFKVPGGVGFTVRPQTVFPDMSDFVYKESGPCPRGEEFPEPEPEQEEAGFEDKKGHCELWKKVTSVGEKKNTYKMWLQRDPKEPQQVRPLFYSMAGYNNIFGSHYDRYDIFYHKFQPGVVSQRDFSLDEGKLECAPMPGPGDEPNEAGQRFHFVAQNPFHEYITNSHNYDHIDREFDKFTKEHSKEYKSDEHLHRGWFNFMHNLRFIYSKNRQLQTFKLAPNQFADLNLKDLTYLRGRRRSGKGAVLGAGNGGLDYASAHGHLKRADGQFKEKLPDSWDWSLRGAVTPVKDQAVCGSCWSFGTSGTVEGASFVKTGKLFRLSQQQMIDCSWAFENNGCDGGEDFRAYAYIKKAGGLATEEDYGHYMGVDGKCHDDDVKKAVQIEGFYNVTTGDKEALKHAIVTYGPVSISIDASQPTFTFYSHGVYFDPKCNNKPDGLDHSVLAVGYAEIDGKFAWQVKNSWSTNWGNNGYVMMSAEENNCGVLDAPTVPIIKV